MIIFPMAGQSSRFYAAGYTVPKYMLKARQKFLFDHAVLSFQRYFKSHPFLFIARDIGATPAFVEQRADALGISDYEIAVLTEETQGQAQTVSMGLAQVSRSGPISIFNIDTFRPNFEYPDLSHLGDGYLEVFCGSGSNWSFVKPRGTKGTEVSQTSEKDPISTLCCTGFYHFRRRDDFQEAYSHCLSLPRCKWAKGELYVAPLYNHLINKGRKIHFHLISNDQVIFCGTPQEYKTYSQKK